MNLNSIRRNTDFTKRYWILSDKNNSEKKYVNTPFSIRTGLDRHPITGLAGSCPVPNLTGIQRKKFVPDIRIILFQSYQFRFVRSNPNQHQGRTYCMFKKLPIKWRLHWHTVGKAPPPKNHNQQIIKKNYK